jgi:hypothetical protein
MARRRAAAVGVAAAGPENLSATLADDRGMFGHGRVKAPRPKISSIRGTGTASRSIPLKASSLGGSIEQAGGRSAPGEVDDLRLDSFRVTPCSRKTVLGGSRPGAGSTCSPAIGWHRFSELVRRQVAAADRAVG